MTTIKDIENQLKATEQARTQLAKTKTENEAQAKEYRTQADAAAVAGDVARYKELKALADDAEAVAYVCEKQLEAEQGNAVTYDQTREAWDDFVGDYNKKLSAALRKFEKLKADMLKEYEGAVELQRKACETRERLASVVGKLPARVDGESRLADLYPMDSIPCAKNPLDGGTISIGGAGIVDPDAVYYLASFKLTSDKMLNNPGKRVLCSVVQYHRAE